MLCFHSIRWKLYEKIVVLEAEATCSPLLRDSNLCKFSRRLVQTFNDAAANCLKQSFLFTFFLPQIQGSNYLFTLSLK